MQYIVLITPLLIALIFNCRIVELLLVNGAKNKIFATSYPTKPNEGVYYGSLKGTPLHWAAAYNKPEVIEVFLEKGIDPNIWDMYDSTPLHEAAKRGNIKSFTSLVNKGANINAADKGGTTPLHLAVNRGALDVVQFLLENGADVTTQAYFGSRVMQIRIPGSEKSVTPLKLARDKKIKDLLIKYGVGY